MEYDRVAVAVRPRGIHESIDLGLAMARWWWWPLAAGLLACVLPASILISVVLGRHPLIALAVFWWLKPLYHRIPLFILSRVVFGERLSRSLFARAFRRVPRYLVGDLSFRRLSPWRSFILPIRLLEDRRGSALRQRIRRLAASGRPAAAGMTVLGLVFELSLFFGLLALVETFALFGTADGPLTRIFGDPVALSSPLVYWLYVISVCGVDAFTVGAGFGLYINRRINLEGWDIELVFRRLAERIDREAEARSAVRVSAGTAGRGPEGRTGTGAAGGSLGAGGGIGLLLMLAVLLACGGRGVAQAPPGEPTAEEIGGVVREVMAREEFGTVEERTVWIPRWRSGEARRRRSPAGGPGSDLISAIAALTARLMPWVLGGGALSLLAYLMISRRGGRRRGAGRSGAEGEGDGGGERQEGPVPSEDASEALPADWVDAAVRSWSAGERRRALSLLYRGSLRHIRETGKAEIPDSATETEAVSRARAGLTGEQDRLLVEFVESATRAWLRQAYTAGTVSSRAFRELCAAGRRLTGARTGDGGDGRQRSGSRTEDRGDP